jgi:hypothetical protein
LSFFRATLTVSVQLQPWCERISMRVNKLEELDAV